MSLLGIIARMARNAAAGIVSALTPINTYFGSAVNTVVWDENTFPDRYAGFPYADLAKDGSIISTYKIAHSHGATGPLGFDRSIDGGVTQYHQRGIVINGVPQVTAALVMKVLSNGRILICYQDNPGDEWRTYLDMKTAYSDDLGATWHQGGYWDFNVDNTNEYSTSIYGRPLELPSGKILIAYYKWRNNEVNTAPYVSVIGVLESVDQGQTWTQGAIIASHRGAANGYPDEPQLTEMGWCILPGGTTDANTRIVGFVRNEEGTGWRHFRSANGGATWERVNGVTWVNNVDYADHHLYALGTSVFARYPIDPIVFEGQVYIVAFSRLLDEFNQFKGVVEYITATPEGAWDNKITSYSPRVVVPYACQANTKGAALDYGYAPPFIDAAGNLVAHGYDQSNDPTYAGGIQENKRVMIFQIMIKAKTP